MFENLFPYLQHFLGLIPITYMALFHVVNPLGSGILFLNLTPNATFAMRKKIAKRIALNSFILLIATLLVGVFLLELFGITIPIVKVCGGMMILAMGWRAINEKENAEENENNSLVKDAVKDEQAYMGQSFFPFTFPFTVGPGSIAVALTISAETLSGGSFAKKAVGMGGAIVSIILIAFTIHLCYAYSEKVVSRMPTQVRKMIMKLFSFVLLCIGGQIVANGIGDLLKLYQEMMH